MTHWILDDTEPILSAIRTRMGSDNAAAWPAVKQYAKLKRTAAMSMTLSAVCKGWLNERLSTQSISLSTAVTYARYLDSFTQFLGPDTPIGDVTKNDVVAYMSTLKGKGPGQAKGSTVHTHMAPIKMMLADAYDEDLLDDNPIKGLKMPRRNTLVVRRLPHDTCTRFLHVADFRVRTIGLLMLHLGLRRIEVSRMMVDDWDRSAGTLLVHGKFGNERLLPVAGETEYVLDMWVAHLDTKRGPMFPSQGRPDSPIGPNQVGKLIAQAVEVARVKMTPHQLRHTCASDLMARGVPPSVVQRVLGHKNLATTSVYTVATDDEIRKHIVGRQYRHPLSSDESVIDYRHPSTGALASVLDGDGE